MAVGELQEWLGKLQMLIDSLHLLDAQSLPPSFTTDLWEPVSRDSGRLAELGRDHYIAATVLKLAELSKTAGHRTWFFWEHATRDLARFANAANCEVFSQSQRDGLVKIHPLNAEEELQEYHWPEGREENPIRIDWDGQQQSAYLRVGSEQPAVVLRFQSTSPLPKINVEILSHLTPWFPVMVDIFNRFRPSLEPSRHFKIIASQEKSEDDYGILGQDPHFLNALALVEQAAPSDAAVYLRGESGTGKELFARYLHRLSDRGKMPFVPINCSAIPHELIESEMFGHEKGAFTGAYFRKIGKIEQAHGGTLFLDEIGEMPLAFQAKLLRYLQEKRFNRVGGNQSIHSDARIVVATHRDLKDMVAKGSFREDLFYRIHVIPIHIPPLRDRGRDIRFLSESFFKKYIAKSRASRRQVDEIVFDVLDQYHFPGNVRELENIIHRTVVMTQKPLISVDDLPEEVFKHSEESSLYGFKLHPFETADDFVPKDRSALKQLKKGVEQISMSYQRDLDRRFLLQLLHQNNGSARDAAEAAGINRTLFYKLLKRAGIDIGLVKKSET